MASPKHFLHPAFVAGAGLVLALAAATASAGDGDATGNADSNGNGFLDLRRQPAIAGDAQAGKAMSAVCGACHGPEGIGVAPNFPNLAGQPAAYLYVQLMAFKGGHRSDPVMAPIVSTLDDAAMRDLAAYYASLPPKPAGNADAASRGAQLFGDGDPGRGIPPCAGCHGYDRRGPHPGQGGDARPGPPWATFPHLQGQSPVYVAKALHDFADGARAASSNARIMHGVAKTLDDADIRSLAEFIGDQ